MTFPLDFILVILVAELYREVEPVGSGLIRSSLGTWGMWGLYAVAAFLAAWAVSWWVESKAHRSGVDAAHVHYRVLRVLFRLLLLVWYAAFLYLGAWSDTIYHDWRIPAWMVVDDVLVILPYLTGVVIWHLSGYRVGKVLWGRKWSRLEHVAFYQRQEVLPVLVPWLLLRGISDAAVAFAPRLPWGISRWTTEITGGVLFVGLLVLFPEWIRFILDCRRLPEGALRLRLQELAERAGVKVKDFLVWRTGGARVASAVLVGAVRWTRYCILSDALLESLEPREIEAVAAHELAHVKGHHIGMYLLVVLMFLGGVLGIFGLLPADLASDLFFATIVLTVLTVVFWRGFFAALSRAAEDEADLFGASIMGDPGPLADALAKVSALAGGTGRLRSWRHRPVEKRIEDLERMKRSPDMFERYHRRMGRLRTVLLVLSVGAVVGGAAVAYPRFWRRDAVLERYWEAATRDLENPDSWYAYGCELARRGRNEEAFNAFVKALEADPGMEKARSSLGSLPIEPWRLAAAEVRVFIRAGRYRDANSVLESAASQGGKPPLVALSGYFQAVPGPADMPNAFFRPERARELLESLGTAERDSLPAVLLRMQLMRLDGDFENMRRLLDEMPAEYRDEPEVAEFLALASPV